MSILLGKNANLLEIDSPAIPADVSLGISAVPQTARWTGSVDAYIDEDIQDSVKGQMRVTVAKVIVDLPVNLPVWPNTEDLLILKRISFFSRGQVPEQGGSDVTPNEVLKVRFIDGGLILLGKLRVQCVRA